MLVYRVLSKHLKTGVFAGNCLVAGKYARL